MSRTDEIRKREQAVTSGPWIATEMTSHKSRKGGSTYYKVVQKANDLDQVCHYVPNKATAEFIAHAHEDIPYLLNENARLSSVVDAYASTARVISLWLRPYCNYSLPYAEMIADATRKASKEISYLISQVGQLSAEIAKYQESDQPGPLSLEQLKQMDGEPVWIKNYGEWAIVIVDSVGTYSGMPFVKGKYFEHDVSMRNLTCYTHKPRQEEEI